MVNPFIWSISQPITKQSIGQSVNQPIIGQFHQSVNFINQSIYRSNAQLINRSIVQPVNQPSSQVEPKVQDAKMIFAKQSGNSETKKMKKKGGDKYTKVPKRTAGSPQQSKLHRASAVFMEAN